MTQKERRQLKKGATEYIKALKAYKDVINEQIEAWKTYAKSLQDGAVNTADDTGSNPPGPTPPPPGTPPGKP